jgi:Predicted sugar phosphatases of the HAD superfamily
MAEVTLLKGDKGPGDYVLLYQGYKWTYEDLFRLLLFAFNNEDRIYPRERGFRGATMLHDAICELFRTRDLTHVLRKFQLFTVKKLHEIL